MERVVNTVMQELSNAGLHVIRGYDGRQLPILDSPMVAVSIADARYYPIASGCFICQDDSYLSSGIRADVMLLLDVYDDYRNGDQACVEAAILAASICSSLGGYFTCGKIEISCVHYEPDHDCFQCSLRVPVCLYAARSILKS